MKKIFTLLVLLILSFNLYAADIHHDYDPLLKTFITDIKRLPNEQMQEQLRSKADWQSFKQNNGDWWVQFNETNAKPHRAFGTPITLSIASSPQAAAVYFTNNYLSAYVPSTINLEYISSPVSKKYIQSNFIQRYNGLEVLWSRLTVKMTLDYKVVMFGADVFDDIIISTVPTLSVSDAIAAATKDIVYPISAIHQNASLKILPVPQKFNNDYHLVYEITVDTKDPEGSPAKYYTLVDANNGEILYRVNKVEHFTNDVTVSGTAFPTNPYNASVSMPLANLKVTVAGIDYYTDANGFLSLANSTPVSATFSLEGKWSQVVTDQGQISPSFNANLNIGSNTVSFDLTTTIQHISGYYHVDKMHDFMKGYFPLFTGLDLPLQTRIDVTTSGTCNANYDGTGINFLLAGGGCNDLSQVSDVVYHEYGHGITNRFWQANGLSFDNGGMGEGYSDVWAISVTNNPVLGIGLSSTDSTSFVRTYDFQNGAQRKIYPGNLTGEVHDNGEIICGAWWSTSLQLGSLSTMSSIFAESHFGLANGPNGSEGQVYTDILIDALEADDNDGNLLNGTPNIVAITTGFAQHGISLLSNATLNHTPVDFATGSTPINIDATLTNLQFAWALQGVNVSYSINNSSTWSSAALTTSNGTNYTTTIPGQPNGTVIKYYVYLTDNNGIKSNVQPTSADQANPNIPYFILVGYDHIFTDDFDNTAGPWVEGIAGDQATTGVWNQDQPMQTIANGNVVQPNTQHTPLGLICYVTGSITTGTNAGDNDVDGGKTTLQSPTYDLTSYTNPTFEFYRWYTNDQGATPGTDFWQVYISNDGTNYVPVENTNVADHSWRKFAFRVSDYVTVNSTISIRFVAEDANAGSLVEALMDDFSLYSQKATGIDEIKDFSTVTLWPNPAVDKLKVQLVLNQSGKYTMHVLDNLGKEIFNFNQQLVRGEQTIEVPVSKLANGIYQMQIQSPSQQKTMKFTVLHN